MFDTLIAFFAVGASQKVIQYILLASVLDVFLGLTKAVIGKQLNSTISSAGMMKHIAMIVVPVLSYPLFMMVSGGGVYWTGFTSLILLTMLFSAVENWCAIGLPFPEQLKKFMDDKKTELVKPQEGKDKK